MTAGHMIREVMKFLLRTDWSHNPPYIASVLFRRTYRLLGCRDPYISVKKEYNLKVRKLYPYIRKLREGAKDRFELAVKLAMAGNIIDFGILESFDLEKTLEETLGTDVSSKKLCNFKHKIEKARTILYIADNAGEIGFDRFLIEEIRRINPSAKVYLGVKRHAVINDATRQDAEYFGLQELAVVIDNGGDWVGTHPSLSSTEFLSVFNKADLIISKGQANWESLEELKDKRITFLLKAKCPLVARALGVPLHAVVLG